MQQQVRIALPSKGRMEGETLDFFEKCGLRVKKTNPRQYSATMPTFPNVTVLFQRPRDIPASVASGDVALGISGYDTVAEVMANPEYPDDLVIIHEALGYGDCALVLAVPDDWAEVKALDDLRGRMTGDKPLRVATKYTNAVGQFLADHDLDAIKIVYADGALEAAPNIGYADFIADITSSGTTLRENDLHPLTDGMVIDSQATFIGNRHALRDRQDVFQVTEQMLELFEAYLRAKNQYMIFANMRADTREDIVAKVRSQPELSGLQYPTISQLATPEEAGVWWSVSLVVSQPRLYTAIQQIRAVGGSGVVVTPVTYIFEERPARIQNLAALLNKEVPQS